MRTLLCCLSVLAAMSWPSLAQGLTQGERDRALSELYASRKQFLDAIAGLTPAQWNFKPPENAWSIAQVAEHIALAEDRFYDLIAHKILQTPADPSKRAEVKGKDERVMQQMSDRSRKMQAPESLQPTGRWPTPEAVAGHFRQSRDRMLDYVRATHDDLRDHFLAHPAVGLLDGYQWLLLEAAHTGRHVAQIEEIKRSAGYPK